MGLGVSSDETMFTKQVGDKKGWPVYATVLNIHSKIRRTMSLNATRLIAYLPIPVLEGLSDEQKARNRLDIYHHCMELLFKPMVGPSEDGFMLRRHDGSIVKAYPILMSFIADNPEQCRAAVTKQNTCPTCIIDPEDRELNLTNHKFRNKFRTLNALRKESKNPGSSHQFDDEHLRRCYPPFWRDLKHTDIFACFTPDLLHQIHKGVFKSHVFEWAIELAANKGDKKEIDRRFKTMPDHPDICIFSHGVLEIKQWTGKEAKAILKVFVGVIAGLIPPKAVRAIRAIIDFIYLASYHSHTDATLAQMQDALDEFHNNKEIFVEEGVRTHFNFNKLHMLQHYVHMIKLMGATNGYNTENTERLHIDLAKNLYLATNKKNYIKQMTEGLQRKEELLLFESYIQWRTREDPKLRELLTKDDEYGDSDVESIGEKDDVAMVSKKDEKMKHKKWAPIYCMSARYRMAKHPSWSNVTPQQLLEFHGAEDFVSCVRKYIAERYPYAPYLPTARDTYYVYKQLYISLKPLNGVEDEVRKDVVRATPSRGDQNARDKYDTVLIHEFDNASTVGMEG